MKQHARDDRILLSAIGVQQSPPIDYRTIDIDRTHSYTTTNEEPSLEYEATLDTHHTH